MSITDPLLAGQLKIEDAEALISRLQEKIAAAKRDAEFVAGGLYLDQHGTAYLAVDNIPCSNGRVRLWQLNPNGATHGTPETWRAAYGLKFRPVSIDSATTRVLMADGSRVSR